MRYEILEFTNKQKLEQILTEYLNDGWILAGNLIITNVITQFDSGSLHYEKIYAQAVRK